MPSDAFDDHLHTCPVCDGTPRVLVAVRHPTMRRFTLELLARDHGRWVALEPNDGDMLANAIVSTAPDVLVVDDGDFPACCRAAIAAFPPSRVVVVGTEPDGAYEAAAFRAGAGAWLPRERVGEDLRRLLREALACRHTPCPPTPDLAGIIVTPAWTAS